MLAYGRDCAPFLAMPISVMLRLLLAPGAALFLLSCGYIGEPLPPALHIPQRVTDLAVTEEGPEIVASFTLPTHTTEELLIKKPMTIELSIGREPVPFQQEAWESASKTFSVPGGQSAVIYKLPVPPEWIGRDVRTGVKVFGSNGRAAGWSNLVVLSVVEPLAPPTDLEAKAVPDGVQLTWRGAASRCRVYRRIGAAPAAVVAEAERPPWTDRATEYGTTYYYRVEAVRTGGDIRAASKPSAETQINPQDTFPPPVPTGVVAVASAGSVELLWDRSTASDLAGYRIYRAEGNGTYSRLAETGETPSYSDRKIEPGKTYRYAVSAFDRLGNESAVSPPATVSAQ